MKEKRIRLLRAEEIECRVDSVYENGITLLLYKDARVDQNVLDETFGMYGWKREHTMLGDAMFCTVSIRADNGEWIAKQDAGAPSYAEPLKGAASDAFKRACVNVGIGRELYTAPFIWIPSDKVEIKNENGKRKVRERFHVKDICYDEEKRTIIGVEISNSKNKVVFSQGIPPAAKAKDEITKQKGTKNTSKNKMISREQEGALRSLMYKKGVTEEMVCRRYIIDRIQDMDELTYERVMYALEISEDRAA